MQNPILMDKPTVPDLSKKAGLPPGTLIHVGKRKTNKVKVSVIDYNTENFIETECNHVKECFPFKDKNTVSWINIDGLHNTDLIAAVGNHFGLHTLLLEDVLNTRHRPKVEEFDHHLFLTLKMLGINKKGRAIVSEQLSFVLGKNWVISFQEHKGDLFDTVRQHLRESKGKVRQRRVDYLLYRLIDTVVDNYFFIIEYISNATEKLEEKVLNAPDEEAPKEIQKLKKQLIQLRKSIAPLREVVSVLQKGAVDLIEEGTTPYLRDVYEHIIQINESIETHRDTLGSIMDLYLSGISNRMNEVMKVLTIIATIFIPLTFIAGIYGMNFDPETSPYNMPELKWPYGYLTAWGMMIAVSVVMIIYFKRKRWL